MTFPGHFVDTWLVYRSEADRNQWVAHSLNTDQLAVGDTKLEAVVALKSVMRALMEAAQQDDTVRVLSPAPSEVVEKLQHATPMSREMFDRAEELVARRDRQTAEDDGDLNVSVDLTSALAE